MQTKASPVLASARTVKIGGVDYRYGPLPYRLRGELENLYFPEARSPYARAKEEVDPLSEEDRDYYLERLEMLRVLSLGWRPSLEEEAALEFFAGSDERWAAFLAVVLPVFNAMKPEVDFAEVAGWTTKGDREEMYSQCVEVGEYAPKSFPRAAGQR